MSDHGADTSRTADAERHVDVLIVGAGISGIGAAYHLQTECPERTYAIVEARDDIGGTWDLFRYPGVRSDSDMHTLGFGFKPWVAEKSIADGPSILAYLHETVAEYGIDRHIRFGHRVRRAAWNSATATWTVSVDTPDGATTLTCNFLSMCAGYYRYSAGHTPEFAGLDRFAGTVVHPQAWPDDLDHTGKRVVVIGSGATAMTLVPALAASAAHVTMLQRSPTYVVAMPDVDRVANGLRRVLPARAAYRATRAKNTNLQQFMYRRMRANPAKARATLLARASKALGPDFDVATHLTPRYDPWDQRLCLVPNGDLFDVLRDGSASIVTDEIDTFTERGIAVRSGEHLDADIVVTATGLHVVTLGEAEIVVDGEPVDFAETWTYKGFMYSGVPEPGVHVRLRQRLVDTARRSHRPRRVPPARPHGGDRHRHVHPATAAVGRDDDTAAVARPPQLGLRPARRPPVPQAQRPRAVGQPAGLPQGQAAVPLRAGRRRRDALHEIRRPAVSRPAVRRAAVRPRPADRRAEPRRDRCRQRRGQPSSSRPGIRSPKLMPRSRAVFIVSPSSGTSLRCCVASVSGT